MSQTKSGDRKIRGFELHDEEVESRSIVSVVVVASREVHAMITEYTSPYEPGYQDVYPDHPECSQCGKPLRDWVGNIMVGRGAWRRGYVDGLRVWCKECTREADARMGTANVPHNIWELSWVHEDAVLDGVLRDIGRSGLTKWSQEAIEDFRHLLNMVRRPGEYPLDR